MVATEYITLPVGNFPLKEATQPKNVHLVNINTVPTPKQSLPVALYFPLHPEGYAEEEFFFTPEARKSHGRASTRQRPMGLAA